MRSKTIGRWAGSGAARGVPALLSCCSLHFPITQKNYRSKRKPKLQKRSLQIDLHLYRLSGERNFRSRAGATAAKRFKHEKPGRRVVVITAETFSEAIALFRDDTFRFSPSPENDDVWLEIDFQDETFERCVAEYIVRSVGQTIEVAGACLLEMKM